MSLYTTKTGSKVLGVKQDTLKRYALKYGIGSQPGGPGTPHLFTREELLVIKDIRERKWVRVQEAEDRDELELPPEFDPASIKSTKKSIRDMVRDYAGRDDERDSESL